ncbi:MAG: branched-chain amino acid transport system substrate-binding protein [Archaeoglobaceae archaeon]|nr:branched-chain amino acid transport system substrate-binding protein [Archaeoglobaceae archaeon]
MKARNWVILALVVIVAILAVYWALSLSAPPAVTPTPKPPEYGGKIYIGYTGPLSGIAGPYGQNVLNGIRFAIEDINNAGGIVIGDKKYELDVIAMDDKYYPPLSVANAVNLSKNGTTVIFCPHAGGILELQKINEKGENKFIVAAYTSSPPAIKTGNKMILLIPPNFEILHVPTMSDYFLLKGMKKAALLPGTHDYGQEWAKTFKDYWTRKGGEIVAEEPINYYVATNYTENVSKVLAAKPEVILLAGPSLPVAGVIKTARALGYTGGFIVSDQAKLDEIMYYLGIEYDFANKKVLKGDISLVEKSIGVTSPCISALVPESSADPYTPFYKYMCENLQKRLGDVPVTWEHVLTYETTFLIAKAIEGAGSTDPEKIMEAMEKKVFLADGYRGIPKYVHSALLRVAPYGTIGVLDMPSSDIVFENGELIVILGITPKFWGQDYMYTDSEGKIVWG